MSLLDSIMQIGSSREGGGLAKKLSGFTLIELAIVILIMAILATIAAPSLARILANTRLTSQANELVGDIAYARNESATRGVRVTICASTDGASCNGGQWSSGRIVFVDSNADGTRQTSETLLRVSSALSGNDSLASVGFSSAAYIQFRPYGGLNPPTSGYFKLCSSLLPTGRQISVMLYGSPTTTNLSCP